ncbi:MAG: mandelate racemase/muconate lactonizing enzyme family protein [Mesorhizobium sp.]
MRIRLFRAGLVYASGLAVHTASSGAVARLEEIYLLLEEGGHSGVGEARINAAYLNGLQPEALLGEAERVIGSLPAGLDSGGTLDELAEGSFAASTPLRMMIDAALRDLDARRAGVSVAEKIAGSRMLLAAATNQTLFWCPFEDFRQRALAYVERGFRDLKVRVGIASFDEDIGRLRWLRDTFGAEVEIAVDANGTWPAADALARLERLAALDIAYAEQPTAAGDWQTIEVLARRSPLPVMLDESLASWSDVERICSIGGRLEAHVKLLKLGGIGAALKAARRIQASGVPVMVGQMNEGGAATAAALQLAVAISADRAELYGADGLANDPVSGVSYGDGIVRLGGETGLGITFDTSNAHQIMEVSL